MKTLMIFIKLKHFSIFFINFSIEIYEKGILLKYSIKK